MITNLEMIDYILQTIQRSNFYSEKIDATSAEDLRSCKDISVLPFTTKKELLSDQEKYPPFGSNVCVDFASVKRIHKTSGTTNTPLLITLTERDIDETVRIGSACFRSAGLKSSDLVIHCLNYNMWAGGYTDHQSLEATGAAVIPFGVGNSHLLIEMILLLKPSAIHCTPSYLKKLELIIRNDFNLKPVDLGIKLGLFGAESGLQHPEFRHQIEETWGMRAMNANYGLSDVLSMFGSECEFRNGLHFMGEKVIFPELINIETLENIEIIEGAIGELVLTNLKKEAQPLIRYRTNDVIKVISTEKCECGLSGFRFEIVGRSDDMLNIRGLNVFLSSFDHLIDQYLGKLNGIYQVLVNKIDPIDQVIIRAEVSPGFYETENLKEFLINDVKQKIFVSPVIELVRDGELPRTDGKTKKILRIL